MRVVARIYFTAGVTSVLSVAVLAATPTGASDPVHLSILGFLGFLGVLAFCTAIALRKLMLLGWFAAALISGISFVLALIVLFSRMILLPAALAAVATQAYILVTLFSYKGTTVCSSRYRRAVEATPQIKCPTPLSGWIFPGLAVFVILATLRIIFG